MQTHVVILCYSILVISIHYLWKHNDNNLKHKFLYYINLVWETGYHEKISGDREELKSKIKFKYVIEILSVLPLFGMHF